MGLECSGDINDITFYELAEVCFVLLPAIKAKYDIQFYARFRDDIFIVIGGSSESRVEFVHEFRRHSRFYKLKVESISKDSAPMLDLRLHKGRRFHKCRVLDISMFVKPSAQGVPLSHTSWHHPTIHRSWPESRCLHFFRCCNDFKSQRLAMVDLLEKLRSSCLGHPSLPNLAASIAHGYRANGKLRTKTTRVSRIVLPYHPCLRRINARLTEVFQDFVDNDFADLCPQVAWSLGGRSILSKIQAHSHRTLGSPGGDLPGGHVVSC